MTQITTQHAPGTFCWPELHTSDHVGGRKFYQELLGWGVNEVPMGPQATYTVLQKNGQDVGALYAMDDAEKKQNIPPHWLSYASTADVDASAAKVKQLGGTVLMEPFDVMELGRMAVAKDPTGAVFALWQAKSHIGARVLDEVGSLCWTELVTKDTKAAEKFYTALFGWTAKTMPMGTFDYTMFSRGEQNAGGMLEIQKEWGEVPPNWLPYFAVADCDKTVEKAQQLCGEVVRPPTDVPNVGRFAILRDPQGATFAIIKLIA
jgi:predicted enzyme related to lactoylglutathione lyase